MQEKAKPILRKPGRPLSRDAPNSRQALVDAAQELFANHGFNQISTKRIAAAAGLNPAMIQYHFGGKGGLLEAAFRETIGPVIDELTTLSSSATADDAFPLRRFFAIYMSTLAANPWLPRMVVRHVLPEGGRLQHLVVSELAGRAAPAIAGLIMRGQQQKRLREDLNPVLTTLSIISLAIFPFLSVGVTGRVLDFKLDAEFVDALIEHTATLFYQGAGFDRLATEVNHDA